MFYGLARPHLYSLLFNDYITNSLQSYDSRSMLHKHRSFSSVRVSIVAPQGPCIESLVMGPPNHYILYSLMLLCSLRVFMRALTHRLFSWSPGQIFRSPGCSVQNWRLRSWNFGGPSFQGCLPEISGWGLKLALPTLLKQRNHERPVLMLHMVSASVNRSTTSCTMYVLRFVQRGSPADKKMIESS